MGMDFYAGLKKKMRCNTTTTPGTVTPFNLTVMNAVPASLSGKMATVDIEAITNKGQTFGGGDCVVNVVP